MLISINTTIRDLERLNSGNVFELEFTKCDKYEPVILAALLQLLLSQSRKFKELLLKIDIGPYELEQIKENPLDYYHLSSIVLFSENLSIQNNKNEKLDIDELKKIFISGLLTQDYLYSQDPENDIYGVSEFNKGELEKFRKRFFSKRSRLKIDRGVCFMANSFDHLKTYGLDKSYYLYTKNNLKESSSIKPWLQRLFEFGGLSIQNEFKSNDTITDLSTVIYELFQNTDEWAKTTYGDDSFYNPSFRSVIVNIFLDQNLNKEISTYETVINEYLRDLLRSNPSELDTPGKQSTMFGSKWGICELSILDTGPGMGRRWLKKGYPQITLDEELSATIKCFNKYMTSDTSGRKHVRGRGLSRVISIIGKSGLLRVRTGRISLFRDFRKKPLDSKEFINQLISFDNQSNLNEIEGTSVSIIYPFTYNPK